MDKIPLDTGPYFKIRSTNSYATTDKKVTIFNSLGGKKGPFEPIDIKSEKPTIKMYVCGLTPYDTAHMGHLVPALRFDLVRNYLEYRNLQVNFVQNVTDIDDKIINRVKETGEDPLILTERVTRLFYQQLSSMHIRMPSKLIKVTESIPQIITYIEELIAKGSAYATEGGNVYFDVAGHPGYGKLSNQRIGELLDGVRVDAEQDKKNPLDFALWKNDRSSSLSTDSPWGTGRPGWHIECSVMIDFTLGTPIDIHGGGLDLKFPHHENEVAQSEAHDNHDFAKCWMHVGLLTVDGTKMSKSLGNFLTIEDAFNKYGSELIRYLFLTQHYRSNVNLSEQVFADIINPLWDLYRTIEQTKERFGVIDFSELKSASLTEVVKELVSDFEKALDDDFNSPLAVVAVRKGIAELRKSLSSDNHSVDQNNVKILSFYLVELGKILGLFNLDIKDVFIQLIRFVSHLKRSQAPSIEHLRDLLMKRQIARNSKDFESSDKIREELAKYGLEYLDSKIQVPGSDLLLNLRFNPASIVNSSIK